MLDYIRIACAVPSVQVGNVTKNAEDICGFLKNADAQKVDVLVFPELALTGYTCGDLFLQHSMQQAVNTGLEKIVACSAQHPAVTAVVGLPAVIDQQLYNCAAVIGEGRVQALIPKMYLPDFGEFSEKRWFAAAKDLRRQVVVARELGLDAEYTIPVCAEQPVVIGDGVLLGVEICEDLWAPISPSAKLALSGAEVIVNLAAANETVGKRKDREALVKQQSSSCTCIYAFCSAGAAESTQDLVFSGHSLVAQNGTVIGENEALLDTDYMLITDGDLGVIRAERSRNTSFRDAATVNGTVAPVRPAESLRRSLRSDGSFSSVSKHPFVPQGEKERLAYCLDVFEIQVAGLKHRLETINACPVVGISGGLDSTLALLVAVEAVRQLGRPVTDVHGITMPCYGTSDRTYRNAWELMRKLGVSSREINIREAVATHFRDIGHDPENHDTTYENAQARERTQILMDYAGRVGGIVVGTGDLSELALGWCTYNGDHMSMYSVNSSVPKTMLRWVIAAVAEQPEFICAGDVLEDILDTPISPELLPPDATGSISQQTEDIVGPYALHAFFLYYMIRYGFGPRKLYHLASCAFREDFDSATVKKWLITFCRRFFTQQFKRNCQPDGVKVGVVGFSPRGDWRMPSDASARIWLDEAENL